MSLGTEEFMKKDKNEIIANNLYGENHDEKIDQILADENITQRRKEDMLFNMLDELNYTIDESQIYDDLVRARADGVSPYDDSNPDGQLQNYPSNANHNVQAYEEQPTVEYFQRNLNVQDHHSSLICGRILTKIAEKKERCSTIVLKLIDLMLSKNNMTVMEGLVYRFLNFRV